jgi:diguanylate cyclase (GGDEF)-like protein
VSLSRASQGTAKARRQKSALAAFRAIFDLPHQDADLAKSQLAMLARHIPLLYIILTASALILAATHFDSSPPFLTLVMPGIFCLLAANRIIHWRRLDAASYTGAMACQRMKSVMVTVCLVGAAVTAWALSLYPYGNAAERCDVAFFMAITVISCILCLMHLRGAALLLTTIVVLPFTLFVTLSGNPILIAMLLNLLLVAGGLLAVMLRNYQDFAGLVVSRRETQSLSDDNLRLANSDALTGLPNRRSFLSALHGAIATAPPAGFAVAIIDLDRFKSVNDIYGHSAGDRMLAHCGERLATLADATLFIARLGGDEFGAILQRNPDEAGIAAFGAKVQAMLEAPFTITQDAQATIGCSIGVATYPQNGRTAEELFERADYALYDGKQHHKGQTVRFSQTLETRIRQSSRIEQALRKGALDDELWLAFQPIMDATTGDTLAFEALARWNSQDLGPLGPDVFIPIAERAQLINQLTEILFAKALAAAESWPADINLAFNLSAQDIGSPATMAQIHHMVRASTIVPSRIFFEITETALLQDFDTSAEVIEGLHRLGAGIALDDFGTGFSSLGYVHRLKLDKIKIDRSFITDIDSSERAPKIVRSIIDLCRNLDLACVVEGVETSAQLTVLLGLGARAVQGHLFSRPMPQADIPAFLATHPARGRPKPRRPLHAMPGEAGYPCLSTTTPAFGHKPNPNPPSLDQRSSAKSADQ